MKKRIVLAVIVAGLGIAGMTTAQPHEQAVEPQKPPIQDKATLRARVIKLRAEVDLLQLEHEAERGNFIDLIKAMQSGFLSNPSMAGMIGIEGLEGLDKVAMLAMMGNAEATKGLIDLKKEVEKAQEKGGDGIDVAKKAMTDLEKKSNDAQRSHLDRKREEYLKQAAILAEKRLDLEDAEKLYSKAD